MNTDFDSFVNYLTVFFDRAGTWFLMGDALAHFVCSGDMESCRHIQIGMVDVTAEHLLERMSTFGLTVEAQAQDCIWFDRDGYTVEIVIFSRSRKNWYQNIHRRYEIEGNWIKAPDEDIEAIRQKRPDLSGRGLWRQQLSETRPHYLQLPYCYGTILDATNPGWYLRAPRRPYPLTGDIFFNEERKKNGRRLISGLYDAAERVGISDRLFAGFGTCLGYLKFGDFIAHDRDLDMCLLSDGMTLEQNHRYGELAYDVDPGKKPSRWDYSRRKDTGAYVWFSVGYRNPVSENGTKSCNWFFFSWNGFWIHSKGGKWVNPRKINQAKVQYLNTDEAIGLCQPITTIGGLVEVDFGGIKMKIPDKPGACCDWWYPGWSVQRDEASAHRQVMIVGKWEDQNTWRLA